MLTCALTTDDVTARGKASRSRRKNCQSTSVLHALRTAPRGSLHAGRSTGGLQIFFYSDLRSMLMVLWCAFQRYFRTRLNPDGNCRFGVIAEDCENKALSGSSAFRGCPDDSAVCVVANWGCDNNDHECQCASEVEAEAPLRRKRKRRMIFGYVFFGLGTLTALSFYYGVISTYGRCFDFMAQTRVNQLTLDTKASGLFSFVFVKEFVSCMDLRLVSSLLGSWLILTSSGYPAVTLADLGSRHRHSGNHSSSELQFRLAIPRRSNLAAYNQAMPTTL